MTDRVFFHESGNTKLLTFPIFFIISPDPLIACNYSKPKKNTSWLRSKSKSSHTIIFCVGLVHIFELFLITGQSQRQGNKNTIRLIFTKLLTLISRTKTAAFVENYIKLRHFYIFPS